MTLEKTVPKRRGRILSQEATWGGTGAGQAAEEEGETGQELLL